VGGIAVSTSAANRAYEERFMEQHGMSRGAYRWANGDQSEREKLRQEYTETGVPDDARCYTLWGEEIPLTIARDRRALGRLPVPRQGRPAAIAAQTGRD
jgi:hypothetical protein